VKFQTSRYNVTMIDTPGHPKYMNSMIAGVAQVDCTILVVSAKDDEFEASLKETRKMAMIAYATGSTTLIAAVNKIEKTKDKPFNKERFDVIVKELSNVLKRVGYKDSNVVFVPVSGFDGDNVVERSLNMPWLVKPRIVRDKFFKFKDTYGETLKLIIDHFPLRIRPVDTPFRLPIRYTSNISGIGAVIQGIVSYGVIKPSVTVKLSPGNITAKVKAMEEHHQDLPEAIAGVCVGLNLEDVSLNDIRRGMVAGNLTDNPPVAVKSFVAMISILDYPGKKENPIYIGYTPLVSCHVAHFACRLDEIKEIFHPYKSTATNIASLKKGERAIVKFTPIKPVCVEPFKKYPQLGRLIIRDNGVLVAGGVVMSVEHINESGDATAS